jgi:predicted GNAT family acetyltransferase
VQALHTHKDFRRRGIATALMHHLLDADAAHGATHSVLMASHSGARLYPSLGYQRIGTLLFFRRA